MNINDLARMGARQRLEELKAEMAELEKFLGVSRPGRKPKAAAAAAAAAQPEAKPRKAKKAKRAKRTMTPEMKKKLAANLEKARAALAAKKAEKK